MPAWSGFQIVQRMRTFSRAQHVVSTIICWCCHSSHVGGDFGVKQGEFFAEQLLQPAHEPYRIQAPSRAAVVLPSPSGFSPSYRKLWYLCWRDVIFAGRRRKSSASFGQPAIVSLRKLAAVQVKRSPDEPTGRANARPLITPRHPGFVMSSGPAYRMRSCGLTRRLCYPRCFRWWRGKRCSMDALLLCKSLRQVVPSRLQPPPV